MLPLKASSSSLVLAPKGRGGTALPLQPGMCCQAGACRVQRGTGPCKETSQLPPHKNQVTKRTIYLYKFHIKKRHDLAYSTDTCPGQMVPMEHSSCPPVLGWCRTAWPLSVAAACPPVQQEGHAAHRGWRSAQPNRSITDSRDRTSPASLLEPGVCTQQPLNGLQEIGHAVVPSDVLEDGDLLHEHLQEKEAGKEGGCPALPTHEQGHRARGVDGRTQQTSS